MEARFVRKRWKVEEEEEGALQVGAKRRENVSRGGMQRVRNEKLPSITGERKRVWAGPNIEERGREVARRSGRQQGVLRDRRVSGAEDRSAKEEQIEHRQWPFADILFVLFLLFIMC